MHAVCKWWRLQSWTGMFLASPFIPIYNATSAGVFTYPKIAAELYLFQVLAHIYTATTQCMNWTYVIMFNCNDNNINVTLFLAWSSVLLVFDVYLMVWTNTWWHIFRQSNALSMLLMKCLLNSFTRFDENIIPLCFFISPPKYVVIMWSYRTVTWRITNFFHFQWYLVNRYSFVTVKVIVVRYWHGDQ